MVPDSVLAGYARVVLGDDSEVFLRAGVALEVPVLREERQALTSEG